MIAEQFGVSDYVVPDRVNRRQSLPVKRAVCHAYAR